MTHEHGHHQHADDSALPELLDLDAEIFAPALREVYADIERAADSPVRSVVDLGAGTGAGTFGLLAHFTDARAIAVDASAAMLTRVDRQAQRLGLAGRVVTLQADLDEGVPHLDPVDLVWASASLHHLADPDRTLVEITALIRPGGLLAVAELSGLPCFVPHGTPGAAAEQHAHQLLAADRAVDMPTMGSDWGTRLSRSGLVVEEHRPITVELTAPAPASVSTYAALSLTRIRSAVADRLDEADRAALDALLDGGPGDVRRRLDLQVSAERWLWIARRPL